MAEIRLRDIVTLDDRASVMGLRLAPGQDDYVSSMPESFEEADREPRAMPVRGRCMIWPPARSSDS